MSGVVRKPVNRRRAAVVIVASVVVICIPLAVSSLRITQSQSTESTVTDLAENWASRNGWEIASVTSKADRVVIRATGPLPEPETGTLRSAVRGADLGDTKVNIELIPSQTVALLGDDADLIDPDLGTETTLD